MRAFVCVLVAVVLLTFLSTASLNRIVSWIFTCLSWATLLLVHPFPLLTHTRTTTAWSFNLILVCRPVQGEQRIFFLQARLCCEEHFSISLTDRRPLADSWINSVHSTRTRFDRHVNAFFFLFPSQTQSWTLFSQTNPTNRQRWPPTDWTDRIRRPPNDWPPKNRHSTTRTLNRPTFLKSMLSNRSHTERVAIDSPIMKFVFVWVYSERINRLINELIDQFQTNVYWFSSLLPSDRPICPFSRTRSRSSVVGTAISSGCAMNWNETAKL